MSDYGLSEYKRVMTEILKTVKEILPEVDKIKDSNDPRWIKFCDGMDVIAAKSKYAYYMVMLHVDELERRWRH